MGTIVFKPKKLFYRKDYRLQLASELFGVLKSLHPGVPFERYGSTTSHLRNNGVGSRLLPKDLFVVKYPKQPVGAPRWEQTWQVPCLQLPPVF